MQITSKFNGKCQDCGGVIAAGERCEWERGAGVRHIGNCPTFEELSKAPRVNGRVTVEMGVFKKDGRIYVVKPNKEKTRVYAKEIVESPARMTESGLQVDFTTVYAPGVVFKLTEADRWDIADAQDFLTKFARCIVCGRHLKAAKSVANAIGPICFKYFAHNKTHAAKPCKGHSHAELVAETEAAAQVEAAAANVQPARRRQGRLTIEREQGATYSKDTFAVYEGGVYPRSSVLAGRPSRKFVDGGFDTVEAAKAAYPEADVIAGTTYIPTEQMVSHLPDDTDY